MQRRLALVLGANGGVGAEITHSLLRRGWKVRALTRKARQFTGDPIHRNLEWVPGDALRREDVISASEGAAIVVHAVNPAKYHNWRGLALPMLDNTLAAAEVSRARIVFPGSLYNFGRETFPLIDEAAPQIPHTRKGAVRVEMEDRLRAACWDGRARVLIVRCGDFFGASAKSSWFSQGMVMAGQRVRFVMTPGDKRLYHSWAYLPDVSETIARLVENENVLRKFDTFHFKGHWLSNGDMANVICAAAGISHKRVLPFPWRLMQASSPFVELSREMMEMRYLWDEPIQLDNRKLIACLGNEPHTPIEAAVRAALIGIGCLNEDHRETATNSC